MARVRLVGGTGNITVNGVDVNDYMPYATLVMDLKQPLVATGNENRFDIDINVKGGGFSGQTGAIRLGITRALLAFDANTDQTREDSYRHILKMLDLLQEIQELKNVRNMVLRKQEELHNSQRDRLRTTVLPHKLNVYGVFLLLRYSLNTVEIGS